MFYTSIEMSPAASGTSQSYTNTMLIPATGQALPAVGVVSETFAKDANLAWYRGEFAAANAIIDELCNHIAEIQVGDIKNYESAFIALHKRRMNWIPVLQRQPFVEIAEVASEFREVARKAREEEMDGVDWNEEVDGSSGGANESARSEINDTDFQEVQDRLHYIEICSKDDDLEERRAQINLTKGFIAKEPVKGNMMNVVRGLKIYDNVFTDIELSKLTDYVNELRVAGQNGYLSGETFIMYNQAGQQLKGGVKRELIQLGAPIFGRILEDATNQCLNSPIEHIPAVLNDVIDHLVQWQLIPETRMPNSIIINFFDEGDYSQPFVKPPHLDQPISTLLLSDSEMAFGRTLVCDDDGKYEGSLMLSLKEGSLLVMRGSSADVARHVMCSSPTRRITITFFRVRMDAQKKIPSPAANEAMIGAMTLWQPGVPNAYAAANGALNGYEAMDLIPWGVLPSPMVMLRPVCPMVPIPQRMSRGGTGVFLPWNVNNSRRHTRHLPPRARRRFLELSEAVETQNTEVISDADMISIEGK